jgi:GTP pyrophosphokinase
MKSSNKLVAIAATKSPNIVMERAALLGDEIAQTTLLLLRQVHADNETLVAAKICLDNDLSPETASNPLVKSYLEAQRVFSLYVNKPKQASAEGLRRLLLSLILDIRIVLILLAEQLARLRAAAHIDQNEKIRLAQLTADIHAPLANRLGIWQFKWELEDFVLRFLQPDMYKRIANLLDERREDRERYINEFLVELRKSLVDAGIDADVAGRPKHIYSIWKKMQRKQLEFSAVFDVRAVRILVADVPACYAALGVVHANWSFISGEFDDYIAKPKGNSYRSLHSAVVGPENKAVEVQIRSRDMHEHAELGFAAHWKYKEGGGTDARFQRRINALRDLLQTDEEATTDTAILSGLRSDAAEDRVYVLTPKGEVVDLPKGATVLDFAYHIHTELGHRCRGAKINGRIVPLTFQPRSGDAIEILSVKEAKPSRDWMHQQLGFLFTSRARSKVKQWFNKLDFEANARDGKELLERDLRRMHFSDIGLTALLPALEMKSLDELYVAVALGDCTTANVCRVISEQQSTDREKSIATPIHLAADTPILKGRDTVVLHGVGNLLTQLAHCCEPVPGDRVIGFITRGRGISVHRSDCTTLAKLAVSQPERVAEVTWGATDADRFTARLRLRAYDRGGLLKDVTSLIAALDVPLTKMNSRSLADRGLAEIELALKVRNYNELSTLIGRLHALPNMLDVRRRF